MGKWRSLASNPGGLIQEPDQEHLAGGQDPDGVKAADSRQSITLQALASQMDSEVPMSIWLA